MTGRKSILIIESDLILGAGIENLIKTNCDLDVIGMTMQNQSIFANTFNLFQPNVVIIDEQTLRTNVEAMLKIIADYPCLRLIVLSLHENRLEIYDKQQVTIEQSKDFFTVL